MTQDAMRTGFIALIGEPNAGKSTLLNQLVGAQVSIVTHKVQTTRIRIRGIAMRPPAQLVFIDTPGLFAAKKKLEQTLVSEAWAGVSDADIVVLLVEATRGLTDGVKAILEKLKSVSEDKPVALAINKIDRVQAETLLELTKTLNDAYPFQETFMISALKNHGTNKLLDWLAQTAPEGPGCTLRSIFLICRCACWLRKSPVKS
jgi:GTPase